MVSCLAVGLFVRPAVGPGSGALQRATAGSVIAIQEWVASVSHHSPGSRDAAVAAVWAWTPEIRAQLPLELFERVLLDRGLTTLSPTLEERRIAQLATDTRQTLGANEFFKRAAVLHTDAALLAPPASIESRGMGSTKGGVGAADSVTAVRLPVAQDGAYVGLILVDWNWRFARGLLDLLTPRPAADPFLGVWYHATTAHMLSQGRYAEAGAHLEHAAALLPNDPRIVFDRACLSEALGLPLSQRLLTMDQLILLREPGFRKPSPFASPASRGQDVWSTPEGFVIPTEEQANAAAERLLRRTVQLDAAMLEAWVRLARLVDLRGRHQEADVALNRVFGSRSVLADSSVVFYAHLFAARANRAMGRLDVAKEHVQSALQLFPNAQSALLAASQLALLRADWLSAVGPMRRLSALPGEDGLRTDPWWDYHLGPGRDADRLLRDMSVKLGGREQ